MSISAAEINEITDEVRRRLGSDADPELVNRIVGKIVAKMDEKSPAEQRLSAPILNDLNVPGTRVIVSAMGINHPGIVAGISTTIAECNGDIQDISQKILQEFFVMIMIVNIDHLRTSFNEFKERLIQLGSDLGIKIFVQHEDIFRAVNRV